MFFFNGAHSDGVLCILGRDSESLLPLPLSFAQHFLLILFGLCWKDGYLRVLGGSESGIL